MKRTKVGEEKVKKRLSQGDWTTGKIRRRKKKGGFYF